MEKRTILVGLTAVSAVLCLFVCLCIVGNAVQRPGPNEGSMLEGDPEVAMKSLNSRLAGIKNVRCEIKLGLLSWSSLRRDKPDKILLTVWSGGKKEALVGCDGKRYWFSVKSFEGGRLYSCDVSELKDLPLRSVMRPEVISSFGWVDEIEAGSDVYRTANGFAAEVASGCFKRVVEFDSEKILTQTIYQDGFKLVTLEGDAFEQFSGVLLPSAVRATWHEEGMSGRFSITDWKVNQGISGISEPTLLPQ